MDLKLRRRSFSCLAHVLLLFVGVAGAGAQEVLPYAIASSGPHHRVWQRVVAQTNQAGTVIYRTNGYTELSTGLNRWTGSEWVAASDTIALTQDGGAATNSQHQVYFPANLNTTGGIHLVTPHGDHLHSTVLGLKLFDMASGSNAVIAEVQDSIGQLLQSSNQVIYTNALLDTNSSFQADVLYTHKRSGFEQDIILRQQLPSPADYGLDPHTTRLQVWTEFFNPPEPAISSNAVPAPVRGHRHHHMMADQSLDFNSMQIGMGNAFALGAATNGTILVPVAKQWVHQDGRTFLIEEVLFDSIAPQMSALPPSASLAKPSVFRQAFARRPARGAQATQMAKRPLRLAQADVKPRSGFLLDYQIMLNNQTNFTFQSDTTYYVTNEVDLFGATTLEGGTVIKYATNSLARIVIPDYTNLICQTAPYRPAIFTAKDDDSVGTSIPGSTGAPTNYYGGTGVYINGYSAPPSPSRFWRNLRFSYLREALYGSTTLNFYDMQFVNCLRAIRFDLVLNVRNCLFSSVGATFYTYADSASIDLQNVTVRNNLLLVDIEGYENYTYTGDMGDWPNFGLSCANSLIDADTATGIPIGVPGFSEIDTNTTFFVGETGIYQTVGAGGNYLADGSPYRGVGTTNIDSTLLADLRQLTTHPPVYLTNTITTNTILGPIAARDTNASPDLGYHYPPIDYLGSCVVSNATVVFTNGVVLGYYSYAVWLEGISTFMSRGAPEQRNYIVPYRLAQEQPTNIWGLFTNPATAVLDSIAIIPNGSGSNLTMDLNFTTISSMNGAQTMFESQDGYEIGTFSMINCELYFSGAQWFAITTNAMTSLIKNNLFHRPSGNNGVAIVTRGSITVDNNLFMGAIDSGIYIVGEGSSPATNLNNVFDYCDVTLSGAYSNNAYLNGSTLEMGPETNCIITNLTWVTGPLGFFYQPTNSPLINMGNTTADLLGLYHFTAQTNEVKETNSIVDVGYHYVAVDTNGNPDSTLWFGIPDYLTDTNGDGAAALVSWQTNYFGHIGLDPNADPFGQGTTLLQDYQSGADLTAITFYLTVTNNYVRTTNTPVALAVSNGIPAYVAVLVDNTNFSSATWSNYTSNITINLGTNEGWHQVWIGVSALPTNATPAWQWKRMKLDVTPPTLVVTGPSNTIAMPTIQITGYSSEALSGISFDLTNAAGSVSNQPALILNQFYSTNTFEFTTNNFQAFDVPLQTGTNRFSFHATDLAGNVTTTNYNFILDYSSNTNAPVVQFIWPQNGMAVCGSNFVCSGTVSDPTASVMAQMINTNGTTNVFPATVGRDGVFYLQNLPLGSGTNNFTLVATNFGGHASTTNLAITQGGAGLTVNPVTANQTTVTGTIGSSNYTVWVNGVKATTTGGTWEADNVPVPPNNSVVQAAAIPDTDNGGDGTGGGAGSNPTSLDSQSAGALASNSGIYTSAYNLQTHHVFKYGDGSTYTENLTVNWQNGGGGLGVDDFLITSTNAPEDDLLMITWPTNAWPQGRGAGTSQEFVNGTLWEESTNFTGFDQDVYEHCDANFSTNYPLDTTETYHKDAQIQLAFATGGPPGSTAANLWMATLNVNNEVFIPADELQDPPVDLSTTGVPATAITLGVFGKLGADSNAFAMLPDNTTPDVTYAVAGNNHDKASGISINPVTLVSLTVVSNATQVSTNDWAAVKATTNDWVYLQATLSTANTNAATFINWSGSVQPVPGNVFQRRVSKAISDKFPVTASLGSSNLTLNVWIVWADWTKFNNTGPKDSDSDIDPVIYGAGSNFVSGTQIFENGTLMQCTISPSGFAAFTNVVYDIARTKERGSWQKTSGVWSQTSYVTPGTSDGPGSGNKDVTVSVSAHIYSADLPGILTGVSGDDEDVYKANFIERAYVALPTLQACSDDYAWHSISWIEWNGTNFQRKSGANEITTGAITVGTNSIP